MTIARLSYPPDGDPPLGWWRPLLYLARDTQASGLAWVLDIDWFEVRGCVHRSRGGPVIVYRFRLTDTELYLDVHGRTCRWVQTPRRRSPGYFRVCDPEAILREAGLIAAPIPGAATVNRRGHLALVQ